MPDVLNPALYRRLKRRFRVVRVNNPGEAMSYRAVKGATRGQKKLIFYHTGEYYQVCCPYCGDTRFRLYVNHMFGQRDRFGREMNFLAVCFNETACMSNPQHLTDFIDDLQEIDGVLERARIMPGVEVPHEAREMLWPGPYRRLDELPVQHKARHYLEGRGFDPDVLARRYGLAYCTDSHYFLARDRLIIPVFEKGKLKGWQARHIGELNWKVKTGEHLPPKYFTAPGMARRLLIYNFEQARKCETGVIVEGPSDVWAFGGPAVCTFGATMTGVQLRRFLAVFRQRSAILLFDPDAMRTKRTKELIHTLSKRMPGHFAAVRLPEGTDPGQFTGAQGRAFLWDYVKTEARKQGVRVRFRKWEKVR